MATSASDHVVASSSNAFADFGVQKSRVPANNKTARCKRYFLKKHACTNIAIGVPDDARLEIFDQLVQDHSFLYVTALFRKYVFDQTPIAVVQDLGQLQSKYPKSWGLSSPMPARCKSSVWPIRPHKNMHRNGSAKRPASRDRRTRRV